jgi:hypothetical protein
MFTRPGKYHIIYTWPWLEPSYEIHLDEISGGERAWGFSGLKLAMLDLGAACYGKPEIRVRFTMKMMNYGFLTIINS